MDEITFGNPRYKYFMSVQSKCPNCDFDLNVQGRPWILKNEKTGEFTAYCPTCETELGMTRFKGTMKDFLKETLKDD